MIFIDLATLFLFKLLLKGLETVGVFVSVDGQPFLQDDVVIIEQFIEMFLPKGWRGAGSQEVGEVEGGSTVARQFPVQEANI
jgi:hypothetical protein